MMNRRHARTIDWARLLAFVTAVGSGTGAVARQDLAWLDPGFPPACPFSHVRGSVSSSRHLARSVRISRTTRSCTLRIRAYETYHAGAPFGGRKYVIL